MTVISLSKKKQAKVTSISHSPSEEDEEQRYRPIDWPLLRRTLSLLAPFKNRYALGIGLGLFMTIADMMSPKFTQWIINYGIGYSSHEFVPLPAPSAAIRHV